jgi:hypothetical protein
VEIAGVVIPSYLSAQTAVGNLELNNLTMPTRQRSATSISTNRQCQLYDSERSECVCLRSQTPAPWYFSKGCMEFG